MSLILNLRRLGFNRNTQAIVPALERAFSSVKNAYLEYEKDPSSLFTDAETQKLLKSMTRLDVQKLLRRRTTEENKMEYKFMTTEQLEEAVRHTVMKSQRKLQMPPIIPVKTDETQIISKDGALKEFSDSKFVITDITFGVNYTSRKVVVRQTDGTLEYAPMDVAKRMKQIYFPLNGRKLRTPKMFEGEYFQKVLDEQQYEFILDRLTVQFEPYEQEYHSISSKVFQHLNETKSFEALRSTRHFGPMAFFYAWHRCIDDLLYDMIKRDYLKNGVELISLMYKIHNIEEDYLGVLKKIESLHPDPTEEAIKEILRPTLKNKEDIKDQITSAIGKTKEAFEADQICIDFIENYLNKHALKKVQIELALQTLKELNIEKKQLFDGLNRAHGV